MSLSLVSEPSVKPKISEVSTSSSLSDSLSLVPLDVCLPFLPEPLLSDESLALAARPVLGRPSAGCRWLSRVRAGWLDWPALGAVVGAGESRSGGAATALLAAVSSPITHRMMRTPRMGDTALDPRFRSGSRTAAGRSRGTRRECNHEALRLMIGGWFGARRASGECRRSKRHDLSGPGAAAAHETAVLTGALAITTTGRWARGTTPAARRRVRARPTDITR